MLGGEVGGKEFGQAERVKLVSVEAWSCSKAEGGMGSHGGMQERVRWEGIWRRQTDRQRQRWGRGTEKERETEKQKENKKVRRKEVDGQEKEERAGGGY